MSDPPCNDEHDAPDLVVRAKHDRAAFGLLYDRFFPLVHRYCRRRLDDATADDVTAEVFLQVARAIRRFPGTSEDDFRRWVYRIATNAIAAQWRQRARRDTLVERAQQRQRWMESQGTEPATGDEMEAVAQALAALNERDEALITLRYLEGLSFDEVGQIIEARPATVRAAVSRAMRKLRRNLAALRPEIKSND
jgi:RNA polymerase sigma-70 factor (ECF subfamily)